MIAEKEGVAKTSTPVDAPDIVERLALVLRKTAMSFGAHRFNRESLESYIKRMDEGCVRAVLSELAAMGGDLPRLARVAQDGNGFKPMTYNVWLDIPSEHCRVYGGMTLAEAEAMAKQINARSVAPILAAQDATIAEQARALARLHRAGDDAEDALTKERDTSKAEVERLKLEAEATARRVRILEIAPRVAFWANVATGRKAEVYDAEQVVKIIANPSACDTTNPWTKAVLAHAAKEEG